MVARVWPNLSDLELLFVCVFNFFCVTWCCGYICDWVEAFKYKQKSRWAYLAGLYSIIIIKWRRIVRLLLYCTWVLGWSWCAWYNLTQFCVQWLGNPPSMLEHKKNNLLFKNTFLHVHHCYCWQHYAVGTDLTNFDCQHPHPPPQMDRSQSMNADCKIPDHSISVWIYQICCMIFFPTLLSFDI